MEKYLVVTDSTSAMDLQTAKDHGIVVVPLNVIINDQAYLDHYDISNQELCQQIEDGVLPSTSQPSVGYIEDLMNQWKKENYEAIFILTVSSFLSGTYQSFSIASQAAELNNVHIIDSLDLGATIMDGAICATEMAKEGYEADEIVATIKRKFSSSFSFLYPKDLNQLKKGGRISPAAAKVANLLKIKTLLYLLEDGSIIEKYALLRSEKKVLSTMVDKWEELKVSKDTHNFYILHCNNMDRAIEYKDKLVELYGDIDYKIVDLPAVLTCHAGIGCVAVQTILKR